MSEQVEMEEEDKNTSSAATNQSGEKKRFEVKKVYTCIHENSEKI